MRFLKWLGAGEEHETPRYGILSSRKEWHSFLIGISVGFITALSGGKDAAWMLIILAGIALGSKEVNIGHLKHIKREPVYALVGAVIAFLLTAFAIIPHLPGGIF
jgi:uncharacterized membrane protein YjjP (DUF1212 family)